MKSGGSGLSVCRGEVVSSSLVELGVGESDFRSTVIVPGRSAHTYAVLGSCGHDTVTQ